MNKFDIQHLDLYYGDFKALKDINLEIQEHGITAFIGPSGCARNWEKPAAVLKQSRASDIRSEGETAHV